MFEIGDRVVALQDWLTDSPSRSYRKGDIFVISGISGIQVCSRCDSDKCRHVELKTLDDKHHGWWCPTRFALALEVVDIPGIGEVILTPRS